MTTTRERLVQLTSGERLAAPEDRDDGVITDAGIHSWEEVEGFWVWSHIAGRYLFIPR